MEGVVYRCALNRFFGIKALICSRYLRLSKIIILAELNLLFILHLTVLVNRIGVFWFYIHRYKSIVIPIKHSDWFSTVESIFRMKMFKAKTKANYQDLHNTLNSCFARSSILKWHSSPIITNKLFYANLSF